MCIRDRYYGTVRAEIEDLVTGEEHTVVYKMTEFQVSSPLRNRSFFIMIIGVFMIIMMGVVCLLCLRYRKLRRKLIYEMQEVRRTPRVTPDNELSGAGNTVKYGVMSDGDEPKVQQLYIHTQT
eukprot:TRINITY_DN12629_c0_g1_i1.p1 TRINITY_DN12629_c0_g1~~TRINITY_DN12629_c0_g1_i1.p1  ORF type:complete len:143 (-),score=29.13 TRINITY_DN12629_c0_g1_i1:248-616(-)